MGPLIPDVISTEFSYVLAVILGFGFGFALEQAGFSSTRKLVGLFYGYDFTVLKVFFTAGVTAMLGVLLLAHIGLLDLNLIYINPTFLRSALIGGGIMGAGFIIGGFCPGTSVCAASVGKLDGLIFVFGSILGIFLFTEGYPWLEELYMADNLGQLGMHDFFNMSRELFALVISSIAVGAFLAVSWIQAKVTGSAEVHTGKEKRKLIALGALPFIFLGILAFTPDNHERILGKITESKKQQKCVFKEMSADYLADELMHNYYRINLIDVRSPEQFKDYHLPLAFNIPLDSMMNREWEDSFNQKYKRNVFYADDDTTAKMACLLAKHIGSSENYILKEPAQEFRKMIFEAEHPLPGASKIEMDTYNFRIKAALFLKDLAASLKNVSRPSGKKLRKVKGGCT